MHAYTCTSLKCLPPISLIYCTSCLVYYLSLLINDCYHHHRRSFFSSLPSETCKLTINQAVSTSLSYIRLKDLFSRSPGLLRFAMDHISTLLQGLSQTQDYGEREVLLPLLHLMKECLTMMVDVDYQSLYKLLMPFYTWPSSHSETVKDVLGMLLQERKVRGTLYRRTVLSEHQLDLNLRVNKPKANTVVMLIDTSCRGNYGNNLYQSMIYHQEKPPTLLIKRLLLSSVLHSLSEDSKESNISKMEANICKLSEEKLTSFCEEGIDVAEQAVAMENMEESKEFLKAETKELYKKILEEIPPSDQKEGVTEEDNFPTSFVLPPPYIPVYELEQNHFSSLVDKLQDILTRLQRGNDGSTYPDINIDSLAFSASSTNQPGYHGDLSHTSLASSTGSCSVDEFGSNPKSSTDLSYLGNDVGTAQNGTNRSVSPTVKSDPGIGLLINKSHVPGEPPLSPISKKSPHLTTKSLSLQITSGPSEGEGFGDMGSQDSDKDTSDTSSSRASEEIVSRVSIDTSSTSSRKMERRYTESFTSSSSRRNLSLRGSGFYPHQMVSPTSSIGSIVAGSGSRGSVKQRANPSGTGTLRQRRANTMSYTVQPKQKRRLKKVKMLIAGDDTCISNAAKAYSHLRIKEPNLFSSLDLEFLYIPLSKAIIGGSEHSHSSQSASIDLPEPTLEIGKEENGQDVMIGQYLSHTDTWYEQNVMLAVHNSLRLLLNDSNFMPRSFSMLEGLDTRWLPLPTPSRVIVNIASHFLREALHPIHAKIFRVKMTLKSDKAAKGFEHRESFMFHRIDIQRLPGKKGTRNPKPYEASVALTELSLDNSFIKSDLIQMNNVWIIRGSNIPHPWDLGVPNPESECFELTIIRILSEGGMLSSTKHKVQDELQYHVYEMVVESAKEKPLSVIIDNDLSSITENVIRVEVSPAYIDQVISGSSLRRTERQERQMVFPLMSFWPVDL